MLSQGLTLEEELLLKELLLEELLLEELLLEEETTLLLAEEAKLLLNELDEDTKLLLNEDAKLLLDELLSGAGGGVLLLLPPPPPQAVSRVNILPNKMMCFNISFPILIKVVLLKYVLSYFDWIDQLCRENDHMLA